MAQAIVAHGGLTTGERIQHLYRLRGTDRETVAALIGASDRSVRRWEKDEAETKVTELGRLAIALRTSADYLVGLTDDPDVPNPDSPTRVWLKHVA